MKYYSFRHYLPDIIFVPLFGDRKKYGREILIDDIDWNKWLQFYFKFYSDTQKNSVGKIVNDAGYRILKKVNLTGMKVLEIGPGILPHRSFWEGVPKEYSICDIKEEFLTQTEKIIERDKIKVKKILLNSALIPIPDNTVDIILSFYNLEHLYPLDQYLKEFNRILRSGGLLVGAIPCEGGLAWGAGRFLTSRRYVKKNSNINYDKIICWEHPNFAEEILLQCKQSFKMLDLNYWPIKIPLLDANLVVKFIYQKY